MKRIATIALLALACMGCGVHAGSGKQASRSMEQIYKEDGVPVRVRILATKPFSAYLKYPATLKARLESAAVASIPEVVREVHARIGDHVRKGDVIVSLSQDNANYQQAKAARDAAEATYTRFKTMYDSSQHLGAGFRHHEGAVCPGKVGVQDDGRHHQRQSAYRRLRHRFERPGNGQRLSRGAALHGLQP